MNRREVLWALMAITLPRGGGAQARERVRRLGYLSRFDDGAALRKSLAAFGHVEGINFKLLVRNAESGQPTEVAAAELVRERVDALFAAGDARILVLRKLARTIPRIPRRSHSRCRTVRSC